MSNFLVVRLGKDSVADIRAIDAIHESPSAPLKLTINCKQVPSEAGVGDFALICFGSDNSQGAPTDWIRGLRGLGVVSQKNGGPGYNDPWSVNIDIYVVLHESATKRDLLAKAPQAYFWCSGIPCIGIEAN